MTYFVNEDASLPAKAESSSCSLGLALDLAFMLRWIKRQQLYDINVGTEVTRMKNVIFLFAYVKEGMA